MSGEILFLAHRLPFPPDRGDRIRSHHILKALAKIAPVHVGCFVDGEADLAHAGKLSRLAASYCIARRAKPLWLSGAEALLRQEPVSLTAFGSGELADWTENLLSSGRISAIYVFSGQMGQFVPHDWAGRLVADLVDVDSAKFEAYARQARFPKNWINAREGRLLARFEAQLAARADHTLLVSEAEAQLLRSRAGDAGNIRALGNGIDAAFFAPQAASSAAAINGEGPHFVFTGQMDYQPNIAAVQRMARAIMPGIRRVHPAAQFHIVGRAPTAAVRDLDGQNGVRVHGEVPDVRPFLAAADVVVAPLTIARGVQNKVLEAMAMARPVLLSPQAATGIDAQDQRDFVIAADDDEFIAKALDLVADRQLAARIGLAAREFVIAHQGWSAMLADLPGLMGLDGGAGDHRDVA
ncbi:TIGR03087 family PEP-CTERM/XrtA system glycosyltransferase [Alteraurantiacibacter aestuarii]|uniref:TIGR03087 family PEP-CTERM/XrtA system glycosyltransferase n=1 Tax=Alteraurantiacibacter aestuarii TaxID=650004 RepID=UPI0031D07EBA